MKDGAKARVTLAAPTAVVEGIGLHSGKLSSVTFRPAPSGAGFVFVDRASGKEIPASAQNVIDTSRCTQLGVDGFVVQTVEHVLSALSGCGVDDAIIEISGTEMPAVDGSAAPFAKAIRAAGLREQSSGRREAIRLEAPVSLFLGGSVIVAEPAASFSAKVIIDYPKHAFIGTQVATFDASAGIYDDDVAPARTYGFLNEVEALRSAGLALGASAENALVLCDTDYLGERRFENELARHKLLDLIGDLALAGRPLCAAVTAIRPGHTINTSMARLLLQGQTGQAFAPTGSGNGQTVASLRSEPESAG